MLNRKLLWLMPAVLIPGGLQAATLTVGLDGGDYAKINDAIADARNRDTILVYPGLYTENVDFQGHSVILKSTAGPQSTTIQGTNTAIYLHTSENADSRIEGFTLKSTGSYVVRAAGADPTLADCIITGARSSYAAHFNDANVVLDGVTFDDNQTTYNLYAAGSSSLTISDSQFVNNQTTYGGGVSIVGSSTASISDSEFLGNVASSQGGAIYLSSGAWVVSDGNRFIENESTNGGAFYLASGSEMSRISNSEFAGNSASASGGAIYNNATRLHVNDSIFADNVANTSGGALYFHSSSRAALLNNTLMRNEAGNGGGVYQHSSSDVFMYQNIIAGTTGGGAVHTNHATNSRNHQWYNLFYDNYPSNYEGNATDQLGKRGNFDADPLLDGFIDDRDPDNDDFTPASGSPAIDGGSTRFLDADGSYADIGVGGSDDSNRSEIGDIVVAPTGQGDYASVTEAVAAADDEDKIVVYPGLYFGNVDFGGKNVHITGAYGPAESVMVGTGTLLTYDAGEDETSVLENLTALTSSNYSVYAVNSSPVFRDVDFRLNRSSYYVSYHSNSQSTYTDVLFEDNYTAYTLYMTTNSDIDFDSVTFRGNTSTSHGGAISTHAGSSIYVWNSLFDSNTTTNNGGAIYATAAKDVIVENSQFFNNTAKYGGAFYFTGNTGTYRISDNEIGGNEGVTAGGAAYLTSVDVHFNDNVVYDNESVTGGAIYNYSNVYLALYNNTLVNNAALTAGAIYQYNSSNVHMMHNIFTQTQDGVALFVNHANARNLAWYNLFYDNEEGDFGGAGGVDVIGKRGNIAANPLLEGYSDDGNVYNDSFSLGEDSPAINAGSRTFLDADGSPADLGAGGAYDLLRNTDIDETLVVAPVGDADYRTVAEAVAAADRGDIIVVYPGVYAGNIDFNGKNVELLSAFGPETTTIVGTGTTFTYDGDEDERSILDGFSTWTSSSYGLYVKNTNPRIRNMHFRYHQSSYAAYFQGAESVVTNSVFEDNAVTYVTYNHSSDIEYITPTFHNNRVSHGGGVAVVSNADVLIDSASFENNTASSNGGAVYVSGGGNVRVLNSSFLYNQASYGGAIYTDGATGQVSVRDNVIAFNTSVNNGGAIYNNNSRLYLADNQLVENVAKLGGAIYLHSNAYSAIVNNTIVGNSGTSGGGIYAYNSSDTLVANSIIAYQDDGEGIYTNHANARLLQVYTDIYDNYDGNVGGAFTDSTGLRGNLAIDPKFVAYSLDGDLSNDDLSLAAFSSLRDGGTPDWLDADGTRADLGFGGGDDDARVEGYDHVVSAHGDADFRTIQAAVAEARNGESIAIYPGVYSQDVDFNGKDLTLVGIQGPNATMLAMASYGLRLDSGEGAGLVQPRVEGVSFHSRGSYGIYINGASLELVNSHLRFSQSSYGAYVNNGSLDMDNVIVEDNAATSYTAYYTNSTGTINNTTFQGNRSPYGGGLYLGAKSDVDVTNGHFLDNTVTHHGGGIYVTASELDVRDTVFSNNVGTSTSSYGGAIYADGVSTVIARGCLFFENSTYNWGGALYAATSGTSILSKNSIYMSNSARYGGALAANSSVSMQLFNNNILENTASISGGGVYVYSGASLEAVNNIIAHQEDGEGIFITAGNVNYNIIYNDFYLNYNGPIGGNTDELPETNLEVEMEMVDYTPDRDITNDDQHLAEGSPLIDAGDPYRWDDDAQTDRSDIGAYGGEGIPALDLDGDGYTVSAGDCNDQDATVYPGAPEIEDGQDNDCNGIGDDPFVDLDDDGYSFEEGDCDDTDADINPGGDEVCDTDDNDCDGVTDEGVSITYYQDSDDDGYGHESTALQACTQPVGYTTAAGDCNDDSDAVYQGAEEVCDGLDNNCNDITDEEGDTTYYIDTDNDGYGSDSDTVLACSQPVGYAEEDNDCDENDAEINPGATEICDEVDNNCDGQTDEGLLETFYADADGDGYGDSGSQAVACEAPNGYVSATGDCADDNSGINPGAIELCDELDNNCNGSVDEGLLVTFYADLDNDGYGSSASTIQACEQPGGYADDAGDCDDSASEINPDAEEVCDGVDNNCDNNIDEDLLLTFYGDSDGDGFGVSDDTTQACESPEGYAAEAGDCNDDSGVINPDAEEVCNGFDDNCSGSIDEDFDADGDGVATCTVGDIPADCDDNDSEVYPGSTEFCDDKDNDCDNNIDEEVDADLDGYTGCSGDCDDSNGSAYPGATEVCDGADNDCNGETDEGFDSDSDGYAACEIDGVPADCADDDASINAGAAEVCDGVDNNCNGAVDEGFDSDSDGYYACSQGNLAADCNDSNPAINPGASEVCDGIDNNCDGQADEDVLYTYCIDEDGDGYGSPGQTQTTCDPSDDFVLNCTDINDEDENTYPGAEEVPDGRDNDGDGTVDEDTIYSDDDGDGYSENEGDCDDDDAQTYPGQTDYSDGLDNDCDSAVDEDVSSEDVDGDGVSTADGDCDDEDDTIYPDADEVGDEVDNDCDGAIDEGTELGDDDGDGFSPEDGDCDDSDASSYPGAPEYEDDLDNDCDDIVDEDIDVLDDDGDGFSEDDGDCDDTRPDVYPGATEVDDGVDNNCDGVIDEGTDGYDNDGDGYSSSDGDCDDANPYVSPGTEENIINSVDDDCDGNIDEGAGTPTEGTAPEETPTEGTAPEETPTYEMPTDEETPTEVSVTDEPTPTEAVATPTPTYVQVTATPTDVPDNPGGGDESPTPGDNTDGGCECSSSGGSSVPSSMAFMLLGLLALRSTRRRRL